MKTRIKLIALLLPLLAVGSCSISNEEHYRNIVYFVDSAEYHVSLYTDSGWDKLLDELIDYTVEGSKVTFYNADLYHAKAAAKGDVTYHTSDRNKMKDWCKKMEGEGMTVTITYDKRTKEWSGVASRGRR